MLGLKALVQAIFNLVRCSVSITLSLSSPSSFQLSFSSRERSRKRQKNDLNFNREVSKSIVSKLEKVYFAFYAETK